MSRYRLGDRRFECLVAEGRDLVDPGGRGGCDRIWWIVFRRRRLCLAKNGVSLMTPGRRKSKVVKGVREVREAREAREARDIEYKGSRPSLCPQ